MDPFTASTEYVSLLLWTKSWLNSNLHFRDGTEAPRTGTSGCFQLAVDERRVEDQLCRVVGDLRLPPQFNLALQRLEVPLNPIHSDRERINEIEALCVFGEHRREHATSSHYDGMMSSWIAG